MDEKFITELVFHNTDIRLGFHIDKEKTLLKTFENVKSTPLRSYQIYISNSRSFKPPLLRESDIVDLQEAHNLLERNMKYVAIHGCLLYNMCGSTQHRQDPRFNEKLEATSTGLTSELDIGVGLNSGVVVHIGSCKNKQKGIYTIAQTINSVLTRNTEYSKKLSKSLQIPVDEFKKRRKIILENSAGEGTKIGSNLNEISEIIHLTNEELRDQIRVCIDTAHIFGAGQYDFGDPESVVQFYSDFDQKIGLKYLELFHLNDSRVPFNSKKDRHENLGIGHIFGDRSDERDGLTGLKKFVDIAEEKRIPLIGEPPTKTKDGEYGPGGIWDYNVIKHLTNLEETYFVCDNA